MKETKMAVEEEKKKKLKSTMEEKKMAVEEKKKERTKEDNEKEEDASNREEKRASQKGQWKGLGGEKKNLLKSKGKVGQWKEKEKKTPTSMFGLV